tara:strand:+ start:10491 stop:12290 length:1800 start_codon:yes stop_codon:yes gene_type:complete
MKIKHIIRTVLFVALCISFNSCEDFLEKPDSAGLSKETIFTTMEDAERLLAAAYSTPPWGFPTLQNGAWNYGILNYFSSMASLCDEADNAWKPSFHNPRYNDGLLTANEIYPFREDKWMFEFQAIRSCYLFLENVDQVQEPRPPQAYINMRKAEARAFIAQKYYKLFKRFGGLPWVPGYVELSDEMDYTRMSVAATADSIVMLLDKAIPDLPARHEPGGFGRVNKIAAMAIKARVRLWSASPLYNPADNESYYPSFGQQEILKHSSYDRNRWKVAADATKAAIDAAHAAGYALVNTGNPRQDYRTAVTGFPAIEGSGSNVQATNNTEIIWGTRLYKSYWEGQGSQRVRPYSKNNFAGGVPYVIPLQNLVDLYEMTDGSVQPSNLYDQANPYENLDARFHESILYHNKPFGPYTMDMTPGGDNNPGGGQFFTGYYMHKFFSEDRLTNQIQGNPDSFWPYIRLSELYLNYAEALNEFDFNANRTEILTYLNYVRERAGQPKVENTPQFVNSQEHLRERIFNERAVELAFEEKRYLDLKRLKRGPGQIGGTMYGIAVEGTAASPTFRRVVFEERTFTDKWYLYPIPDNDIQKAPGLVQNPGW